MADVLDWDAGGMLERGVPAVPRSLPAGAEVPVATWRSGDIGAVLSICHDPDDGEESFSQDIEILERGTNGAWTSETRGGSDWPTMSWARPDSGGPALTGCASGARVLNGTERVWIASGVAPVGVDRVRV